MPVKLSLDNNEIMNTTLKATPVIHLNSRKSMLFISVT